MRKRGSSRKKLRIRMPRKKRPPTTAIAAAAARMRPVRVGGMRPRLTGMRRRARRKVSSSVSGSALAAFLAGLRLPVRSGETSCVILARAADVAAGRKNSSALAHHPRIPLHGLLVSRFLPRPSQVVRFAIQTITRFTRGVLGAISGNLQGYLPGKWVRLRSRP